MKWISLDEEMPRLSTWILGYTNGGGIYVIRRVSETNINGYLRTDWMIPAYVRDDARFTHWMPIPAAPEECEKPS
jgi:hypothetical protein